MNTYLARRPESRDRVIELIRSEPFTSRCVIRENTPPRGKQPPRLIQPPDISLREYHEVVVTPGQVISDDRILFPDTYRHNQARRLTNRFTEEVAPRFARLEHPVGDLEVRPGTYFHLDNEVRGHFGHLLTEQLSRLWAWPTAKARFPDLQLLLGTNRRSEVQPYEYRVYEAAGVAAEDVVMLDEPARVERVVSATPMLSNPAYVHPRIAETWQLVGDNLAATAEGGARPSRFFCSRRIKKRSCTNTSEVEALFDAQGFEIIFPEDLTLGDQIETFRKADVIAGFAGSGLFNLCFVDQPKRVIMLSSTAYSARNEYLMASVLGHEIDLVTSEARDPVFQSSFTFDHEREGRDLAAVFATLSAG
jgi:capsular polysaccharide biosynthesis protein